MNDVNIGPGNLAGRGIYAARDFRAGEVVIQYKLKSLTEEEYRQLPKHERMFTHRHHGVINLYGKPERYVNHDSEPNTYQDLVNGCDIALRDIKKGESITTDSTKDDVN